MGHLTNGFSFINIKSILLSAISVYSLRLFIPHSPSFIWVILFILIYSCFSEILQKKHPAKTIIAASVLGFLFSLMTFLSYQLNLNNALYFDIHALSCALCLAIFFSFSLTGIFSYFLHCAELSAGIDSGKTDSKKIVLYLSVNTIIILLCWLPYLISCFPGNLTSDSIGEIRQQLGSSPLSNHHPIIHQIMIKLCLIPGILSGSVRNGVAVYTLLQMIITATAFAYSIVFLSKQNVPRPILFGVLLFFALYTVNGFFSVTMYKDVPFAVITLLLSILLIKELRSNSSCNGKSGKTARLIVLIFLSFLFCTIRNNGYYAFLIGYLFVILFNRKDFKRLLIVFIATVLLVNSYHFILFNVLGIKKSASGEMLSLPLQMVSRVVKTENPDLTDEDFEILHEVIPDYTNLAANYLPDNADPVKADGVFSSEIFDKNPTRYLKSWLHIGAQYPRTYLNAFFLHTQGYWDLNKNYSTISVYISDNEFGIVQSEKAEPLRVFLINLHDTLSNNSIVSSFYSIGFMVVLFIFSFTLLLLKNQLETASPIFILAALWATAAAGPVCLYHYVYGLTVTVPVFLVLALVLPKQRKA